MSRRRAGAGGGARNQWRSDARGVRLMQSDLDVVKVLREKNWSRVSLAREIVRLRAALETCCLEGKGHHVERLREFVREMGMDPDRIVANAKAAIERAKAGAPGVTQGGPMNEAELLELAWGLIANAGEGDWPREHPQWQGAAARWRTHYFNYLDARLAIIAAVYQPETEQGVGLWSRLNREDPRIRVLRLLEADRISVGKACEAMNDLAAGRVPLLPDDDAAGRPE